MKNNAKLLFVPSFLSPSPPFTSPKIIDSYFVTVGLFNRFLDGFSSSSQEASDVLSQILKDLPHKPMKSVGQYSGGYNFNQIPLSDDHLPPFKPLSDYPSYNPQNILPEYGPPSQFSDYTGLASVKKPVAVNPKAYDIYRSMKVKMTREKNFVTLPSVLDNYQGLEIQKSIGYEFKA